MQGERSLRGMGMRACKRQKILLASPDLVVRKLSFLVFFILGMDFGGVAIELGSRGLDGELPVDLDRLGAALVEQGQHLPAQGLERWNAPVEAEARDHCALALDHIEPGGRLGCGDERETLC